MDWLLDLITNQFLITGVYSWAVAQVLKTNAEAIARRVYERHELLTRFFTKLGVPQEIAAADACKVEHILSQETFDCIKAHALGEE